MKVEREEKRHSKVLESIRTAQSKEELPNATLSQITRFLANNTSFDGVKISPTEFKPVLDKILKHNVFATPEVKKVFVMFYKTILIVFVLKMIIYLLMMKK